jgi:hypothetical protein
MEALNMILNAFSLKDRKSNFELIDNDDEYIEYYNYKIKNETPIKEQIDQFNEKINVNLDIHHLSSDCSLSFQETLSTLNYLLSRKEIMNAINDSNIYIYKHFKEIIEMLFSRLIVIFLEKCNSTDNVLEKCAINANICQYSIFYKDIFNDKINKTFENYYKGLTSRCFNIATNYGCIISWMTFAKLAPEMVKDTCYPNINKNTNIYKNIIWNNINENKLFEKELELFNKYHNNSE